MAKKGKEKTLRDVLNVPENAEIEIVGVSFMDEKTHEPVYLCDDEARASMQLPTDEDMVYIHLNIKEK